ncbi:MAG: peptide-methionine (S)-S-oxide reductase MsrA [Sphingomonadaceae bacterium]|uniref:peptide-methionine (S)-S-oxide reductase MsrA n=1 Tax=Thermaurantiacus sp. TaxID=2820283 RepID=UPI00298F03B9|nr:peptide-methionine (S)-S-oxide reductase MsrA [Thermaurantiacus sp.]MCS6986590.1 peptide-methionine (S)-S-oxide reductase MsrA [Sphingomonadaceae bacterium]MDW8414149.1 peptide-methionine (S)-S-oxide reductase MsrA [Thermaurantiacus sp.]
MNATLEEAVVAGGCFWCTEAVFLRVRGVVEVTPGYTGGHVPNPSYRQVCTGTTGHAEAVRIRFDPAVIGYGEILDIFMATHDPTQLDRQGNDVGPQYRSAIFPASAEQEAEARAAIARAQAHWPAPIVTRIEPAGPFWPAEPEHHRYFDRVGDRNPYCTVVIAPKVAKFLKTHPDRAKPA